MTKRKLVLAGAGVCGPRILGTVAGATLDLAATALGAGVLITAFVGMAPLLIVLAGLGRPRARALDAMRPA